MPDLITVLKGAVFYFIIAVPVCIVVGKWLKGCREQYREPEEFEHQDGPRDRGFLDR